MIIMVVGLGTFIIYSINYNNNNIVVIFCSMVSHWQDEFEHTTLILQIHQFFLLCL